MSNIGNSEIKEIANVFKNAGSVMLYPHMNMDGDALGSCVAIAHALRGMGKECNVVISEDIPDNLKFLDEGLCIEDHALVNSPDVSALIDCGELKRIKGREDAFLSGGIKVCIDHHETTEPFCHYNYIDPDAAATGEIVYELIKELGAPGNEKMANGIFTAITTDTGNYQYSNTGKLSHQITAELYDWGLDHNRVSIELYENYRIERLKLEAEITSGTEIFAEGKAAISYVTQEMLKTAGAHMNETEGAVDILRSMRGVEVAIFLKEEKQDLTRVSLRSKEYFDVAELAAHFGGGGHVRASGYTDYCSIDEAIERVKAAVRERM